MDFSIFELIIKKYAQTQPLDPQQIQPGETIYDPSGNEFMVLPNQDPTTDVIVMPADQQGQQIPQGVKQIELAELTTYTTQPQEQGVQMAQTASVDGLEDGVVIIDDGGEGYTETLTLLVNLVDEGYDKGDIVLTLNEITDDPDVMDGVLEDAQDLGFL